MAQVRARSPSPTPADKPQHKRSKTTHTPHADVTEHFAVGLFDPSNVAQLHTQYVGSTPFKHVVVDALFRDDLLKSVKDECIGQLSFTEKETDIYKVNQTGDLASLSYLTDAQRAVLPNLLVLRDALYSPLFRSFVRSVTGCGPLSGTTQDMSVNSYTNGCHLLNHDDVIGTRRVSYILYMPLPCDESWRPEYGGALELYPVRQGGDTPEPDVAPVKTIPPSWNQFVFFEVQPGKSFHSVEEVVVDEEGHARLSISGWFHAAQPDEEGYAPEDISISLQSSREQLTLSSSASTCVGVYTQYDDTSDDAVPPHPDLPLTQEHAAFLTKYINPVYLQLRAMKTLMAKFVNESSVQLYHFLMEDLTEALDAGLREADKDDGLDGKTRGRKMSDHTSGVSPSSPWSIKGPPHKWRYCTLAKESDVDSSTSARAKAEAILRELQDVLFPSAAFRAWLSILTKLIPLSCAVEARRFRPGLDYTLATSDGESKLDVVLGLTPSLEETKKKNGNGKAKAKAQEGDNDQPMAWPDSEWGGWECYMAPHDEEDDPAVYRSGSGKKSQGKERQQVSEASASSSAEKPQDFDVETDGGDDEDEDDEDGTLLTVLPSFNCLLLVLRDEGVLRFVKYVSAAAPGSRWDISAEFEVGMVEDDDDDEQGEEEEEEA